MMPQAALVIRKIVYWILHLIWMLLEIIQIFKTEPIGEDKYIFLSTHVFIITCQYQQLLKQLSTICLWQTNRIC